MKTKMMEQMRQQMNKLRGELQDREQAVQDKINSDTKIYGTPLGNKQLRNKIDTTLRKISRLEERMLKTRQDEHSKWKLPNYDQKILSAIRSNHGGYSTSSANNYRFDQRCSGSANSRKNARIIVKRDKIKRG